MAKHHGEPDSVQAMRGDRTMLKGLAADAYGRGRYTYGDQLMRQAKAVGAGIPRQRQLEAAKARVMADPAIRDRIMAEVTKAVKVHAASLDAECGRLEALLREAKARRSLDATAADLVKAAGASVVAEAELITCKFVDGTTWTAAVSDPRAPQIGYNPKSAARKTKQGEADRLRALADKQADRELRQGLLDRATEVERGMR